MKPPTLPTLCLMLTLAIAAGCHQPSQSDRDNRRLVEQILTALTLKNKNLLVAANQRREQRHVLGELADDDNQALEAVLGKARDGDWNGALKDAYAFRRERPFVQRGQ